MTAPLTGLFLGAGASYEAGMPLVWELTAEIKKWLTADKLRQLNHGWRAQGTGFPDTVVDDLISVMAMDNLHYESILGYLETQSERHGPHKQDYSWLYSWMVDLVYNLLYFRQVNNDKFLARRIEFYEGIKSLAERNVPLWIFSLNHDLVVESVAEKFSIPMHNGFSPEIMILPRRDASGARTGEIRAQILRKKELEESAMHFPNPPARGIYLLKIHGALDIFTFNDGDDLMKIIPDGAGLASVSAVLRAANQDLIFPIPGALGGRAKTVNEIAYADDKGEMQFLRKSLLAGAYKFDDRRHQVLPKSMLKHFRENLNFVTHLVCIGYSFGDIHINHILRDWLAFSAVRSIEIVSPGIGAIPPFLLHLAPQVRLVGSGATEYLDLVGGIARSRFDRLEREVAAAVRRLGKEQGAALMSSFYETDAARKRAAYADKIRSLPTKDGQPDFDGLGDPKQLATAWTEEIHGTREEQMERLLSFLNQESP